MLSITPGRAIQDIQQEFSHAFPFLKVEFTFMEPNMKKFIPKEYSLEARSNDTKNKDAHAQLNLTPGITIKELEEKCEELFGVSVVVYRKFRNLWLITSITKNLTLQQQNDHLSDVATCHS